MMKQLLRNGRNVNASKVWTITALLCVIAAEEFLRVGVIKYRVPWLTAMAAIIYTAVFMTIVICIALFLARRSRRNK